MRQDSCGLRKRSYLTVRKPGTRRHMDAEPALRDKVLARNKLKLLDEPQDVPHCATWLASDEARHVTWSDVAVDAGATAS